MFYETGVCLSLQFFFSEISELQNLINPSILSKKTAVLLKGRYYVNSAAFCLKNSQHFSLWCSSVDWFISSIEGVTLLF